MESINKKKMMFIQCIGHDWHSEVDQIEHWAILPSGVLEISYTEDSGIGELYFADGYWHKILIQEVENG